jgi:hypothetical protein
MDREICEGRCRIAARTAYEIALRWFGTEQTHFQLSQQNEKGA